MLKEGSEKAREVAVQTLAEVRAAMKIDYFDNTEWINEQVAKFQ